MWKDIAFWSSLNQSFFNEQNFEQVVYFVLETYTPYTQAFASVF
jgi:hypothetical protein